MICKHDNAVCICGKGENDYCPIKPLTNEEWRILVVTTSLFYGLNITILHVKPPTA